MEVVHYLASFLFYASLVSLAIGLLYKPWVVLWWMDKQNRMMVIKYYGALMIVSFFLKFFAD